MGDEGRTWWPVVFPVVFDLLCLSTQFLLSTFEVTFTLAEFFQSWVCGLWRRVVKGVCIQRMCGSERVLRKVGYKMGG